MCSPNSFLKYFTIRAGAACLSTILLTLGVVGLLTTPFLRFFNGTSPFLVMAYMAFLVIAFTITLCGALIDSKKIFLFGFFLGTVAFIFWISLTLPSLVSSTKNTRSNVCLGTNCGESHWLVPRDWKSEEQSRLRVQDNDAANEMPEHTPEIYVSKTGEEKTDHSRVSKQVYQRIRLVKSSSRVRLDKHRSIGLALIYALLFCCFLVVFYLNLVNLKRKECEKLVCVPCVPMCRDLEEYCHSCNKRNIISSSFSKLKNLKRKFCEKPVCVPMCKDVEETCHSCKKRNNISDSCPKLMNLKRKDCEKPVCVPMCKDVEETCHSCNKRNNISDSCPKLINMKRKDCEKPVCVPMCRHEEETCHSPNKRNNISDSCPKLINLKRKDCEKPVCVPMCRDEEESCHSCNKRNNISDSCPKLINLKRKDCEKPVCVPMCKDVEETCHSTSNISNSSSRTKLDCPSSVKLEAGDQCSVKSNCNLALASDCPTNFQTNGFPRLSPKKILIKLRLIPH